MVVDCEDARGVTQSNPIDAAVSRRLYGGFRASRLSLQTGTTGCRSFSLLELKEASYTANTSLIHAQEIKKFNKTLAVPPRTYGDIGCAVCHSQPGLS